MPELDPIAFKRNGGLRLDLPLGEVSREEAIDLLDVDWRSDVLTVRDGAKKLSQAEPASPYDVLFPHSTERLLARFGKKTIAVLKNGNGIPGSGWGDATGVTVDTAEQHLAFSRLGTPGGTYTYIADRINTLKRFDGVNFAEPTATIDGEAGKAMPKGDFLATWIDGGNRLVVAGAGSGGPGGMAATASHVFFSLPGSAEEYESTAYVILDPGDGEAIHGCCEWGGQIFVFKETRMFVFYSVSADSEGKPIFNFRTVDLGTRVRQPGTTSGEQIVAGREGVYFVSENGVWVTTGGEPTLLSDALAPLSDIAPSDDFPGPASDTFGERRFKQARGISFCDEQLYVGLALDAGEEGPVTRMLKLDLRTLDWTVWTVLINCFLVWNEDTSYNHSRLFFSVRNAGDKNIYLFTPDAEEDPHVDIEPRWQSGFYDLDNADEKTFTTFKIWGSGKVELSVAEDYGDVGDAFECNLGEGMAIAQLQDQRGQTATLFSHKLSGAGPWSVQRMHRYLQSTRVPATQNP